MDQGPTRLYITNVVVINGKPNFCVLIEYGPYLIMCDDFAQYKSLMVVLRSHFSKGRWLPNFELLTRAESRTKLSHPGTNQVIRTAPHISQYLTRYRTLNAYALTNPH